VPKIFCKPLKEENPTLKFKKASDAADFIEAEDIKRTLLCECNWKSHDFHLRIAFRKQRVWKRVGGCPLLRLHFSYNWGQQPFSTHGLDGLYQSYASRR
jgi:hypothetical protein